MVTYYIQHIDTAYDYITDGCVE